MPPSNTPTGPSPNTSSPTSPPSPPALAASHVAPSYDYLSSPVPDFAATLLSPAADDADAANAGFLRNSLEALDQALPGERLRAHADARRDAARQSQQPAPAPAREGADTLEDLFRRVRLQRVLARLHRLHEPAAPSTTAYSNRTPSPHRQSIYDWAPSSDERSQAEEEELDAILNELRRLQPNAPPDVRQRQQQPPLPVPSRQGNDTPVPRSEEALAERRERLRDRERRRRETEWVSLRTRAALQRSRQEGSPSATDRMLRYVMERERTGISEEEERARGTGWFRPGLSRTANEDQRSTTTTAGRDRWLLPPPASSSSSSSSSSDVRERDRQERVDAFRRGYLAENMPPPPRLPRISTPTVPACVPGSNTSGSSTAFMESALKYLSELRGCSRYDQALSTAIDHGLATKEFFADKHDDFIMDVDAMDPLPYSSWLQPGTVFDGHQYATGGSCNYTRDARPNSNGTVTHVIEQVNPHYPNHARATGPPWSQFDHPPGSTRVGTPSFDAPRPWLSHQFIPPTTYPSASFSLAAPASKSPPEPQHDHWPVRVVLHAIDPEKMTLQGTMEAYDVPQHPATLSIVNPSSTRPTAGKKHAPITTYVEGHIIDLRTHSFLTPSPPDVKKNGHLAPTRVPSAEIIFPAATPQTDAQNWLKLPPFCYLSPPSSANPSTTHHPCATAADEAARVLLSQARMQELNEQFIFMRWKERCFVHAKDDPCDEAFRNSDQDRGHGLTISGFYYVSLRRIDGAVEALYFDPSSTPYQHLRLRGKAGGWPSFAFA